MTLLDLLLLVIGVVGIVWIIQTYCKDSTTKTILLGLVILFVVFWILQTFGWIGALSRIRVN